MDRKTMFFFCETSFMNDPAKHVCLTFSEFYRASGKLLLFRFNRTFYSKRSFFTCCILKINLNAKISANVLNEKFMLIEAEFFIYLKTKYLKRFESLTHIHLT